MMSCQRDVGLRRIVAENERAALCQSFSNAVYTFNSDQCLGQSSSIVEYICFADWSGVQV
jgi:hypothetical protein